MTKINRKALYKSIDFESFVNSPNVKDFIGKYYDHYKAVWTADYNKRGRNLMKIGSSLHINWLALLAGPAVWYCYHKMYLMAGVLAAIYWGATLYEIYAGTSLSTAFIGGNIAIALMTKGQYFFHIAEFMEKNKDLPQPELEAKIAQQGGTSVITAIMGTVIIFGGIGLSMYIGEQLFGPAETPLP